MAASLVLIALESLIGSITDILTQELISDNLIAKIGHIKLNKEIQKVVKKTLLDTISDIPGFQEGIEGESIQNFLSRPVVSQELIKIIKPTTNPDLEVINQEWIKYFGKPLQGNIKLLLELFLNRLKKKIWEIPTLGEILHVKETHEFISWARTNLPNMASDVHSIATNFIQQDEDKRSYSGIELGYDVRLNACRDLFEGNRPNAALGLLAVIEEEFTHEQVSNDLRFRLNTLIGGCELQLGHEKEAIRHLQIALTLSPKNPKALANAAYSEFINQNIDKAIDLAKQALEIDEGKTIARAVMVQSLATKQNFTNVASLVDETHLDNIDYVRALGYIFYRAQDFSQSEKFYRLCLAQNPKDYFSILGLLQLIINSRLSTTNFVHFTSLVSEEMKTSLKEAMELVNTAFEIAKNGDNETIKSQARLARGALFSIGEDLNRAKEDFDEVLKTEPNNVIALQNRGIIALEEQEFDDAINFFKKIPLESQKSENVIFAILKAYTISGQPKKALELLDKYIESGGNPNDIRVITSKVEAKQKNGEKEEVNKIKDTLNNTKPRNSDIVLVIAFIEDLQKDYAQEADLLEEAFQLSEDKTQREDICIGLAIFYYLHKKFEKAIFWFSKLNQNFLEHRLLARAYVQALYSTGNYTDAYKAAKRAREIGIKDPPLIEIESWLAEFLGDLESELALEKILAEIEPKNPSHLVQIARLQFRSHQLEEAQDSINRIDIKQVEDSHDLMVISEIYRLMSNPKSAIEIAYRARRLGQNSPDIQLAYLNAFMNVEDDLDDLKPEEVENNTAIQLVSQDVIRWIKILTLIKPDEGNWEFPPDSPQGRLLLGKRLGDVIKFKSDMLEELEFTIKEIQSIYVRAYQETFEEFGTRFPNHHGLQKIKIIDQDFSKFFGFLFQQSDFTEKVSKFYDQGILSFGQLAKLIGRNQIDVFSSLQGNKDHRVFASIGTIIDQQEQQLAIESADRISLDLSFLLTVAYLGLLPKINTRFQYVYIPQRLLDEFERTLVDRYLDLKKGRRIIGFHEGRPFIEEYAPEMIENNIRYIKEIIQYAHDHFEVIPIPYDLAQYLDISDDPIHNIGDVSIASVLVARSTKSPLLADDARLRLYAKTNHVVFGCWSQVFLQDLLKKRIIDEPTYYQACIKLIKANYFFISVNKELILEVIKDSKYEVSSNVQTIIKGLKGPEAIEDQVIGIGANVLKGVWLSPATREQKILTLDLILQALCFERNKRRVITKLAKITAAILQLAPLQQWDLNQQIELWYKVTINTNRLRV